MSRFRKPHGAYVRDTQDWFADRRMGGGFYLTAPAGQKPSVSLFNDAADGSMLHVYGFGASTTVAGSQCAVAIRSGVLGSLAAGAAVPMTPFFASRAGNIYTSTDVTVSPDNIIWVIGLPNQFDAWPYTWPLCVLAPGYSLAVRSNANADFITVMFQWLSMGPDQGLY